MLNREQIQTIIPHRPPFLFLDRVESIVSGQSIVAYKDVSMDEPHFQGHFPEEPVMPGVLIVEALAQAGAVVLLSEPEYQGRIAYFAGIDKARFKRKVVPGDTLKLVVEIDRMKGTIGKGHGKAYVGDELACSVGITFAVGE